MEKHDPPRVADGLADEGLLKTRRVDVDGRKMALRLEQSYWGALDEICRREEMTAEEIIQDMTRRLRLGASSGDSTPTTVSLANALRVFIVGYFRQAATETGHKQAGHGSGVSIAGLH